MTIKPRSQKFWIVKSKFSCYSIDDFAREKITLWTGIRNYLARNYMMIGMAPGDQILFYHSNTKAIGIYGVGHVNRVNLPDPLFAPDPMKWRCAEFVFDFSFYKPILLKDIKQNKNLSQMDLLKKSNRLSILPVNKKEFKLILNFFSENKMA